MEASLSSHRKFKNYLLAKTIGHEKTTHEGAFGSDLKFPNRFLSRSTEWVEIWKFPSDLNYKVDGFRSMYGF